MPAFILKFSRFLRLSIQGDGARFANAVLSSGDILIANVDSIASGLYKLSLGELSRKGSDKIGIDFNGFDASTLIGEPAHTLIFAESLKGFDENDANSAFIAKNLLGLSRISHGTAMC